MVQRVFIEWCAILALLLAIGLGLSSGAADSVSGRIESVDTAFYDISNQLHPMPADQSLAIIEIDEASLAQIGRWPWPRGIHAALLAMLTDGGARVIGLDILMAETATDDQLLAQAIASSPPVVLPVASETDQNGRAWPIYPVHDSGRVAKLGHAHFSFDRDGVVRGLYLEEGGNPSFALAAHAAADRPLEGAQVRTAVANTTENRRNRSLSDGEWTRSAFALLPSSKPVTQRYSYAQVLRGDVERTVFADKIVFIGATAAGMRDAYSNAVMAGQNVSSGVDLHAAAFNALAKSRLTVRVPFGWHSIVIVLSILLTMLILYLTSPRYGLAATAALVLLVGAVSLLVLQFGHWMPPGGTVIAVLLAYPLWSWRRLETVISGLIEQSRTLESEPEILALVTENRDIVGTSPTADSQSAIAPISFDTVSRKAASLLPRRRWLQALQPPVDPITARLRSLSRAATRINTLRLLLVTALERLPHAALISSTQGQIIIRNRLARESFSTLAAEGSISVWDWLKEEFSADINQLARQSDQPNEIEGVERRDRLDRDWLIDAHHVETDDLPALWLIQFTDISKLRALQREREEMMRFISHDLRSPQISIISALEQIPETGRSEWTDAIQSHAEHSLALAESFIQWTRAENKPFEVQQIDLTALAVEACDAAWPVSRRTGVPIKVNAPEAAPTLGDAQLLRRAIGNLIENALKYGGVLNRIDVSIELVEHNWVLSVSDEGPGLGRIDTSKIFEPYVRGAAPEDRHGTGLGLAFVRMVAERHSGAAAAENNPDRGAKFTIVIPEIAHSAELAD